MPTLGGQIVLKSLATPYTGGFYLERVWRYDEGLIPKDIVFDDDTVAIKALDDILPSLLTSYPETVPQGTSFDLVSGGTWQSEQDAYLKELNYDENRKAPDDPATKATVWRSSARYSYVLNGDPLDKTPEEPYTPWQYPPSGKEYVPVGSFPDEFNMTFWKTMTIAQTYTSFSVSAPYALFLTPETTAGYNLITFGPSGSAIVSDIHAYFVAEGRYPIVTLLNQIINFFPTANILYQGGNTFLRISFFEPYYLDPSDGAYGFYYPYTSQKAPTLDNIVAPAADLLSLLDNFDPLPVSSKLERVANLYARPKNYALNTGEGYALNTGEGYALNTGVF